jgi:AraC-like DNA-binding protein
MRAIAEQRGHDAVLGQYCFAQALPAPPLRTFVREYMGYVDQARAVVRRRELPIADTVIIINLGARWRLLDASDTRLFSEHSSFAAGVSGELALVESTGSARCYQMNLTPLGGYRFFGIPMRELAGKCFALDDLQGRDLHALRERLFEAQSWAESFALLDDFVARRIERARSVHREIAWAIGELERTRGAIRIGQLAEQIGCSRKHLSERFVEQVGTPAKQLAQLMRFNHAVTRMKSLDAAAPDRRLAALALACGYADHAHLSREFRRFSGWSPSEYLRQSRLGDGVLE